MVLHYGGRYRAAVECKYLEQVEDELTEFWSNCQPNSVLVFPPLTAHYRFLIHQLVGVGSRLQTVSIGQGGQRRTVVYLAEEREQQKMADSPSAAHRTFGRGRGRRSRRPDQALYVPGALRRAKLVQQEQASNTECVIDKVNGKEISSVKHNDLTSALPGSAQNRGNNATASYSCKQNSEPKTVKSLFNNKTPESTRAVDVPNRTDSASSNAHKQLVDIQSHVCDNQRVIKEYKEASRELITPRKDGNKAVTDNSGMVLEAGVSNALEVRGERNERNKRGSMNDDQKFERESSNNEAACRKNAVEVHNSENPQACMSALGNFNVIENVLGAVNESCGDLKVLKVDDNVTEQTQGVPTSNANHISVIPGEDETVLQIAESKMDDEKGSRLVSGRNSELKAGLAEISANVTNDWKKGEEVVVQGECCTEKEITTVDGEVSRTFGTCSDDTEARKEQGDNKELIHEHALQNASTAGMTIIECTGSNYETEGFLPQPATCNAGKGFLPTHGDLSASEDDVPNQHGNSGGRMVICDLSSSCQTRSNEDEMINKTAQVTSMWPCKDTSPNSGSVIERDIPSDITLSTCLIDNGKMASQDNFIGLSLNSNKKNEELGSELAKQEEKIQGLPGRNARSPESVVVEFNHNVDELQTEHSKTSSCKKKKTKKEKSKEGEDKKKSKENGERKKKKEKKSGKTEKSDKEEILDSEGKIKEKKKSKTKGLIDKELKRKDLSTVEKSFEAAGSAGDNDDDDNWESNFDESGDCLKPEYLEELSRLTGIKNPEVHKTQFDYYSFTPNVVELDDEEFGHIVEIYNISPDMKTQDIMQALSCFRSKGFDIKWVDDTHALGVFSSRISAQEAIQMCSTPLMKLRPVSQGIPESRKKATNCFEFLQPYKERPQTSKLLADRMVTGALGMRSKMTREERVKEREKLKEAKNKKQQEKIQKAQIWGD